MRYSAENQLRKVVSLMAGAISLIVVFAIPSAYYFVQYDHLSSSLQYKADIIASDVSVHVFQHPDSWSYQEERITGFLDKNIELETERVDLLSEPLKVDFGVGSTLQSPLISRQSDVNDGLSVVASLRVQTSLYPMLIETFYVFILSFILGMLIFGSLFYWPLKALTMVIARLDNVRFKLEDEVDEKNNLLVEAVHLTEKLKSQRDFTNTIFEVANNIIVVLDLHGCFVRFNRAAEEISGYSRDDVLGRPVWDCVIPEENRGAIKNMFKDMRRNEKSVVERYEGEWVARDGHRIILDCSKSALYDQAGEASHVVILGYDITQRKEAEKQEGRLQRELNQARKMEALGQLTGGIAHDFNNMLGIIIGYSDLALSQLDEPDIAALRNYLENISESGKRAGDLVRQMMVFSRKDPVQSQLVDFKEVTDETIKMLRSVMPSSIKINVDFADNLPMIKMDAVQLQQIMMNLFLNAKDAMEGEGTLDIKLGWQRKIDAECLACHKHLSGDWLELSVSDTGHGMSDEVLQRIFEPFYTTKEVGKGAGLGLSMIHTLVENHYGHMLIETLPGAGTTFKLLFQPSEETEQVLEAGFTEQVTLDVPHGRGEKILVVDDEVPLATFIESVLQDNGYQCETQKNGLLALEAFKANMEQYALLLTDQTMPEMTGTSLIAEIRKLSPDFPVMLMTGYSDTINREQAADQGIVFINKPFNTQALLSSISASIKKRARADSGNNAPRV